MENRRSPLAIRQVTPDEWPAYREVRLRSLREDPRAFGSTLAREAPFAESLWRERIGGGGSGRRSATWVCVDRTGAFVGSLTAAVVDGAFRLFAMWVAPEVRRQGAGGRMLDAALAWVGAIDPQAEVLLEVNPDESAAVRLYESRGFRFTGRTSPLDHTPGLVVREMKRPAAG
jgi:ribosomal protein S18 acetylase RimI-like enzyme